MKSKNFIEKILFILLFFALACFVACSSSDDEKEELTDTDTVSDKDPSDDSEPVGDTDSETSEDSETMPDNDENAEINDSETDEQTDNNTEPTTDEDSSSETTDNDSENPEPTEPTTEPDPEFEQNAEGCTMIEVPKITMGGSHADEINGYFSPAMGESSIDIIRMYLLGEIKKGTYELGIGQNSTYMGCQQCVMVWVDAASGTANEYYFQTHGTLAITEVREVDGIKRTVGRISSLILKQVEPLNDYLGDFGFISEGKCIAAEIVEWDTTSTPGNSGD